MHNLRNFYSFTLRPFHSKNRCLLKSRQVSLAATEQSENLLDLYFWEVNTVYTSGSKQRYTYRVLQTIQMKLILLCVWAEPAVLGSTKTALKFKYEI